jgi:hypothetical protein
MEIDLQAHSPMSHPATCADHLINLTWPIDDLQNFPCLFRLSFFFFFVFAPLASDLTGPLRRLTPN